MIQRTNWADVMLPTAVVAVVGMMIFPVPALILDALLIVNIAFGLILLLTAVYLSEAERFTALPTILLLSTLFRLGLNISTTRLVLSGAEVPQLVITFGGFVVAGNPIVGMVIFVIITIVQFIVISKGAERVAEVAARFTLDAMPGKQMSIDADLRSGILSLQDAREKRRALHRESKLFGSLDGAMKFVKGDAIAGLLITFVNLSAGFLLGVTQQGLTLAESLNRYTLFTVGDGLVSQLPALLIAVAAGIAVTRVEDERDSFLGRDLARQLSNEPQALIVTSVVLFVFAFIPGLPAGLFIAAAIATYVWYYKARFAQQKGVQREEAIEFKPKTVGQLVLRVSPQGTQRLQKEQMLPKYVQAVRAEMFDLWGVIVSDVQLDIVVEWPDERFSILLLDEAVAEEQFASLTQDEQAPVSDPFSRQIGRRLRAILRSKLYMLLDDTHTRKLFEIYQGQAEDLINSVSPEPVSVTTITTILRQLLREKVSIRAFPQILQALLEYHEEKRGKVLTNHEHGGNRGLLPAMRALTPLSPDPVALAEEQLIAVRRALSRAVCRSAERAPGVISGWSLHPEIEQMLARAAFSGLPLDPRSVRELSERVQEKSRSMDQDGPLVLLSSAYSRLILFQLLHPSIPKLSVVSFEEVAEDYSIELAGEIQLVLPDEGERLEDRRLAA